MEIELTIEQQDIIHQDDTSGNYCGKCAVALCCQRNLGNKNLGAGLTMVSDDIIPYGDRYDLDERGQQIIRDFDDGINVVGRKFTVTKVR